MPNLNNLATLTSAAKKAAREELRAKAYLAITGFIYRLKQSFTKEIEALRKEAELLEKETRTLEVEARDLSEDHPDKADAVKDAEEARKDCDKRKEAITNEIDSVTKEHEEALKEQEDKLKAVESGEDKVDYDSVVARADKLIALRIRAQHDNGDFDDKETN